MTDHALKNANFKYTVPITKSEADEDGLYIVGEATGPEPDAQGEAIHPDAIKSFREQIVAAYEKGEPIPYVDEHDKSVSGRGVLRHLGDLVDGEITADNHLRVKVKLNEDNPAATFLYRQIQAGKKFGMSISGDVLSYADELNKAIGRKMRVFKSVILTHVANTTRPVWTPSLGTVLNRAVEKALADEGNGEEMETEETVVESTKVEETETVETPATTTETETKVEETKVEETESTEETPNEMTALGAKLDALLTGFQTLVEAIKTKELVTANKAEADETPEPEINKAEDDRIARLEAELAELKETSVTQRPPVLNKAERVEFDDALKALSPSERMRVALAALHGEEI